MALFQINFFSQCLRRSVPVNVLIPCDGSGHNGSYPTLYLLHGYDGDRMDWLLSGGAQETSRLFNIAVVMPSGDNGFYTDNAYLEKLGSEFIARELVDYTRKIFPRLSQKREDTFIGGLSMGAYGTLYNAFRHTDVFGHAIALSAPIIEDFSRFTNDPNEFMGTTWNFFESVFGDLNNFETSECNLKHLAAKNHGEGRDCPDLYIACGYNDMLVHENREFHKYLTRLGVPHFYEEGPGTHEWQFWTKFLRRGLARSLGEPRAVRHPFWIERDEEGVI